jgi:hypothetical protein
MSHCNRQERTSGTDAARVREDIHRHGEVIRHPEGYPEPMVFRSLAYVYTAYALGSRTAEAAIDAHLERYRRPRRPSREMAAGMARGFLRLAEQAS